MTQQIYPCLWFDGKAREAAEFYCNIFENSSIISDNGLVVIFQLNGAKFMGLNGGPMFKFSEALSLVIDCETQEEIDFYWNRLTEGGEESMCGWLKDRYGVSWQVVPFNLITLLSDPTHAKSVEKALLQMRKIDIEKLTQV